MNHIKNDLIENCILHGKFHEALNSLNSIERRRVLSDNELLMKKLTKIYICIDKGDFKKGRSIADEMIKLSQEKNNILREIDGLIGKVENMLCLVLYNDALQLLKKAESILIKAQNISIKEFKRKKAYIIYLKGRICQDTHKINEGINYFKESLKIRKDINDRIGIIWTLLNLGILTVAIGEFQNAEKYITKSLNLAEEFNIEAAIIWSLIHLGWIKYHRRELDLLMVYAQKCLLICKSQNFKYSLAYCYDLIGHYHLIKGNLNDALHNFEISLNLRLEEGYRYSLPQSYYSIGEVYSQKGELRESLKYYHKIIDIPLIDEKEFFTPVYLSTMGKIYGELGDFPKAKKYLSSALDLFKKNKMLTIHFQNFTMSIAKTYHFLIVLSIRNNELENINNYLEDLHQISQEHPNLKYISQIYKLDKAIILKISNRVKIRMKAANIFKKLSEEKIIDHEITIESMTNLCELLIYELELTGNEDILIEIKDISNKLLKIAEAQYLYNLMVEIYLFKAKISLLELDLNKVHDFLSKGQRIALNFDLKLLLKRISSEYDSLLVNKDKWEEMIKKQIPLQKRVNYSRYEFLFSSMVRTKIKKSIELPELPYYFITLSNIDGYCLYEKNLQEKLNIEGDFIAGFISTINLFGKEAFSSLDSINRIKHGDFFIILQSKENFLFGYVFKGQSYSAITKLDLFIKKLTEFNDIFKKLYYSLQSHLELSEETKISIDNLVNEIFIQDNK